MKKAIAILTLAALLVAAFAVGVSAVEPDSTQKIIKATKGTPVIDGTIDEVWNSAESQKLENVYVNVEGSVPHTASFRTLWDDKYLYVLVEVADTTLAGKAIWPSSGNLWKDDSIMFSISPNYNRTATTACTAPAIYYILGVY